MATEEVNDNPSLIQTQSSAPSTLPSYPDVSSNNLNNFFCLDGGWGWGLVSFCVFMGCWK